MADFHYWFCGILLFTCLLFISRSKVCFSITWTVDVGASTRRKRRGINSDPSVIFSIALELQLFPLTHHFWLEHCGLTFVGHFYVFSDSRAWVGWHCTTSKNLRCSDYAAPFLTMTFFFYDFQSFRKHATLSGEVIFAEYSRILADGWTNLKTKANIEPNLIMKQTAFFCCMSPRIPFKIPQYYSKLALSTK